MPRYRIVAEHSRLTINGRSSVHGIRMSAPGLAGWVDLERTDEGIDVSRPVRAELSVPVARLRSGNPLEDRELRRRVDARRFPTIDATLREIRQASEEAAGRYRVVGDITFHGVTRAQEGDATVAVLDGRSLRIEGQATVDVRPFGVEPPRLLGLRVEPVVDVTLELFATEDD